MHGTRNLSTFECLETSAAKLMTTLIAGEVHAAALSQRVMTLALWTFCSTNTLFITVITVVH